jgi:hypothetical protein
MWFRGEFRVVADKDTVVFTPSDENGKRRAGVVVRLQQDGAAKIAQGWLRDDRIFFYHELEADSIDSGYFNDRTREKISLK